MTRRTLVALLHVLDVADLHPLARAELVDEVLSALLRLGRLRERQRRALLH